MYTKTLPFAYTSIPNQPCVEIVVTIDIHKKKKGTLTTLMFLNNFCLYAPEQVEQLQSTEHVRVFAVRRRMRRVRGLQSLYSIVELGTPIDYTGAVASRHRMPAVGRVLHVEIRTPKSNISNVCSTVNQCTIRTFSIFHRRKTKIITESSVGLYVGENLNDD